MANSRAVKLIKRAQYAINSTGTNKKLINLGAPGGKNKFISNLNNNTFNASRLIWKVVDKDRDKIERNVEAALNEAKATLQKNLEKERG